MKYADLHLHTVYSDSTYSPEQLVKDAAACGLSAISVVDHDTVEGITPTIEAAKKVGIEVIPGIELSAEYGSSEVHILGYFFDHTQPKLIAQLELLKKNRIERIYRIVEKLNDLGLGITAQDVFAISGEGTVGRLHVARALLKKGFILTVFEAFQKYIGDRGPAFVLGFKFTPQQAIKLIRDAGGVAVLAHPYILRNDEAIAQFAEHGLQGLEVYYPEHTQSMVNFYLDMAKRLNLVVTGGSDCHGNAKPDVKIGLIKLPYELVEIVRSAAR